MAHIKRAESAASRFHEAAFEDAAQLIKPPH